MLERILIEIKIFFKKDIVMPENNNQTNLNEVASEIVS